MLRPALVRSLQAASRASAPPAVAARPVAVAAAATATFSTRSTTSAASSGGLWDLAGSSNGAAISSSSKVEGAADDVELTAGSSGGLSFEVSPLANGNGSSAGLHDWSRSFHGLSSEPFSKEVSDALLAPVDPNDVEIKPGLSPLVWPAPSLIAVLTLASAYRWHHLPSRD